MKRKRIVLHGRILPIVWSFILLGAVYILIRFAAISFSSDVGQANVTFKDAIMSNLCVKVMDSGSSLIRYSKYGEEEAYPFPVTLVANEFVLPGFIKDTSPQMAMARENSFPLNNEFQTDLSLDTSVKEVKEETKQQTIGFYEISNGSLSKEYILTNGVMFGSIDASEGLLTETINDGTSGNVYFDQIQIGILEGDVFRNETDDKNEIATEAMTNNNGVEFTLEQLKDTNFLINNFYIIDQDTKANESIFNAEVMLNMDMTLKQENDAPQILIYHTHSQEAFVDSREGVAADTVVGIGTYLTDILEEQYGYNVIHDTSSYDLVNGVLDRNLAYNYARPAIEKILEENPTIEVVIDLHRDGVAKRSTMLNGEETAQIMLFNGLCRDTNGPLTRLDNPYIQDNLSFSLQLQMKSLELYPGLFYKNYLHAYRYNQHVRQKSILMELGTHLNTLQSAKNAMPPFAEILDSVLQGK